MKSIYTVTNALRAALWGGVAALSRREEHRVRARCAAAALKFQVLGAEPAR